MYILTSEQWAIRSYQYKVIPKEEICCEITPDFKMLLKIGVGNKMFKDLPYISTDSTIILDNYYTKSETDELVDESSKGRLLLKGIKQSEQELPIDGKVDDMWLVPTSVSNMFSAYIKTQSNGWVCITGNGETIDLSEYAKIEYVDNKISVVNENIETITTDINNLQDTIQPIQSDINGLKNEVSELDDRVASLEDAPPYHTHENKEILDQITAPYTIEEKELLSSINTDVIELTTNVESLSNEIDELDFKVDTNSNNIESLDVRVTDLENNPSSNLQLGELHTNAYYGDRGKIAYDHSQIVIGNPHNTNKNDIGLGNVDDTSDLNKPISTATQNALNNINSSINSISNDITELNTDVSKIENDIESLDNKTSNLEDNVDSLNDDVSALQDDSHTHPNKVVLDEITNSDLSHLDTAYSHSQIISGNPHNTNKNDIGLGNVDDTSDINKPISTATQNAFNSLQGEIDALEASSHSQNTDNTLLSPDKTKTVVYTDNGGDVHIDGDIIQNGSTYETHAEQIYTKKDYVILRDGAVAGLAVGEYTGFEAVKYDGVNNGRLVFDKDGIARVGDVDDEQPLATREEDPLDGGVAVWNATNRRYESKDRSKITYTQISAGTTLSTLLDSGWYVCEADYASIPDFPTNILINETPSTKGPFFLFVQNFPNLKSGHRIRQTLYWGNCDVSREIIYVGGSTYFPLEWYAHNVSRSQILTITDNATEWDTRYGNVAYIDLPSNQVINLSFNVGSTLVSQIIGQKFTLIAKCNGGSRVKLEFDSNTFKLPRSLFGDYNQLDGQVDSNRPKMSVTGTDVFEFIYDGSKLRCISYTPEDFGYYSLNLSSYAAMLGADQTFTGNNTFDEIIDGDISGNSGSATKLKTPRTLSWTGDATGNLSFDGSANKSATLTLAASGVTAGTYKSVTVNAKGLITAGTNPTTLSGYGITDAVPSSRTITAGNGLSGGGTMAANRTITLGTPSTITGSTTNSVTSTSHTHALSITPSDIGAYDKLPTILTSGNNLDDYTEPGTIYYTVGSNVSATINNAPWVDLGFSIEVIQTALNHRMQIARGGPYSSPRVKIRTMNLTSGTLPWIFGDWITLAFEENTVKLDGDQNISGFKEFSDGFGLARTTDTDPKWICKKINWSQNAYVYTVIPLCCLDNTDPSANFFCMGTIHVNRNTGLGPMYSIDVSFRKIYNTENCGFNVVLRKGTASEPIRVVSFMYNGLLYAGIQKTETTNPHSVSFEGIMSNPELLFGIDYYRTSTPAVLNQEVYESVTTINSSIRAGTYFYNPLYRIDNHTGITDTIATKTDIDDVKIGGRNLVRRSGELVGKGILENGTIGGVNDGAASIYPIDVTAGETLFFTKTASSGDQLYWRFKFTDDAGNMIGTRLAFTSNLFARTVPDGATKLHVSYPYGAEVQIERSTKPSEWNPAPEDLGMYVTPIPIPNNSDLNDYLEEGSYYVANSTIASSITNAPYTSAGFAMNVIRTGANIRMQIVYCGTTTMHYIKTRALNSSSGVWSYGEWIDLPILRSVPPNKNAIGSKGQMAVDANYQYICYAENSWIRLKKDEEW